MNSLVSLRGFGVSFGQRTILDDISLDLPRKGMTTIVGPGGAGKSTLLRTLSGLNDPHPSLATWGDATFDGAPLLFRGGDRPGDTRRGVTIVMQHARFFLDSVRENLVSSLPDRGSLEPAEQTARVRAILSMHGLGRLAEHLTKDVASLSKADQRVLSVMCAVASDPLLLLADEPTADLDEEEGLAVIDLLKREALRRSVVLVTHHRHFAEVAGGCIVLVAGGRVQEVSSADTFFRTPMTEQGKRFVATGGCLVPSPDAKREELNSVAPPPPVREVPRGPAGGVGPRGFFWLIPGKLGGLPRPGIVEETERDLEGLVRLGVTTLITLEETQCVDEALLARFHIRSIHFPILDMDVPSCEEARQLAQEVDGLIALGSVVAMHCRAGLGRTGTMLAAQLVWGGESARSAIERVRRLNPRCIQSDTQVAFLSLLESSLRHGPPCTLHAPSTSKSVVYN